MKFEKRCKALIEKIREILGEGLQISKGVLHYIDSTFLNPSVKALEEILRDDASCETQPLFELIFFPDESFQTRLEDFLESEDFKKEDEERILDYIALKPLETKLHFPDKRGVLRLAMPYTCAGQFISRLHVSKKLSAELADAINRYIESTSRNLIKVKLRNTRFFRTENRTAFMCSFFEKMKAENIDCRNVIECLDFILDFFHEQKDDSDIFQSLAAKKKFYFKNLQMTKKFEKQLTKNNIETLILQGISVPYLDKEDVQKKMRIIDRVSLIVYGKIVYLEPAYGDVDLGEFRRVQDIDAIISMLS